MAKMSDKDNGGTHITIIASLRNLSDTLPSLYTYRIVEHYGLFTPTLYGGIASLLMLVLVQPLVTKLSKTKREDFGDGSQLDKAKIGKED